MKAAGSVPRPVVAVPPLRGWSASLLQSAAVTRRPMLDHRLQVLAAEASLRSRPLVQFVCGVVQYSAVSFRFDTPRRSDPCRESPSRVSGNRRAGRAPAESASTLPLSSAAVPDSVAVVMLLDIPLLACFPGFGVSPSFAMQEAPAVGHNEDSLSEMGGAEL